MAENLQEGKSKVQLGNTNLEIKKRGRLRKAMLSTHIIQSLLLKKKERKPKNPRRQFPVRIFRN